MLKWSRWIGPVALIIALVFACSTDRSLKPKANIPPETHLYLQFSDTLRLPGESTSMQVLHWYGDDVDGTVTGFELAWDTLLFSDSTRLMDSLTWTYTTSVMDTFYVPIRVPQDTFTFYVRAIDNAGVKDPTPDHISFPIRNTPPTVVFPIDFVNRYSDSVYNCFSYFSISWSGSDPDGDVTITGYEWYLADSTFEPALRDTSIWNHVGWNLLDSTVTYKIFNDLQPGSYRFYLRCRDVAAAYSPIVSYPRVDSSGHAKGSWRVMAQLGTTLFVDADAYAQISDTILTTSLQQIYGADGYSTWNILGGYDIEGKPNGRISFYPRDIEHTLKLFDKVIWQGGTTPHFNQASDAIVAYLGSGGHLLALANSTVGDTTVYPFLPLDSLTVREIIYRTFWVTRDTSANFSMYPEQLIAARQQPLSKSIGFRPACPAAMVIDTTVQPLYWQMISNTDSAVVAARYPADPQEAKVIYFAMRLYYCTDYVVDLMRNILTVEFEHAGN